LSLPSRNGDTGWRGLRSPLALTDNKNLKYLKPGTKNVKPDTLTRIQETPEDTQSDGGGEVHSSCI
ncbi:hypothetical protein ILYODFUR_014893, partial [Ilyodon furcidens]